MEIAILGLQKVSKFKIFQRRYFWTLWGGFHKFKGHNLRQNLQGTEQNFKSRNAKMGDQILKGNQPVVLAFHLYFIVFQELIPEEYKWERQQPKFIISRNIFKG